MDSDGDAGGKFASSRSSHVGADDEPNAADEGGRNTNECRGSPVNVHAANHEMAKHENSKTRKHEKAIKVFSCEPVNP